jgi:hypothetical protein
MIRGRNDRRTGRNSHAVLDALKGLGVTAIQLPLTPEPPSIAFSTQ